MKKKINKKIIGAIAILMAGVLAVSLFSCNRKKKQKNEKEVLDRYDNQILANFDFICTDAKIVDDMLYLVGMTSDDNYENIQYSLVKYNMETKEENKVVIAGEGDRSIGEIFVDNDGNIFLSENLYISKPSDVTDSSGNEIEDYELVNSTYKYDSNLTLVEKTEDGRVSSSEGGNTYKISIARDKDGDQYTLYAEDTEEEEKFYVIISGEDGSEKSTINIDYYADKLVEMGDGTVAVSVWGDESIEGTAVYSIDKKSGKLGEIALDTKGEYLERVFSGKDGSMLFLSNDYLYRTGSKGKKSSKVLRFFDCDVESDTLVYIYEEDGGFLVISSDYDDMTAELCRLTKIDKENISAAKQEIHLATFSLDYSLQRKILKFNKSNTKYRIVTDIYADENEEYEDAIKRFNADIISGKDIDIIDLSMSEYNNYAQKGALEDLTPYFGREEEYNLSNYLEGVVKAYTNNGKIYCLPASVQLNGYVGATSVVGEENNWTMQEFRDFVKSLPNGVDPMRNPTCDGILGTMLYYGMDEYVDFEKNSCNFNDKEFVALLELCSKYPDSETYYENMEEDEDDSEVTLLRNKKVMMEEFYIGSVEEFMVEKEKFGEDVTIKGYPVKEGSGIVVTTGSSLLGIGSKSKHKDEAWDFIKEFYSEEYQQSNENYGFPLRKSALDKSIEKEMDQTWAEVGPDGNKYMTRYDFEDVELYVPYPNEQELDTIYEIINSADRAGTYSEEIMEMILEEAQSCFKGEKDAKDVADVIQSRVSIYLKENS